MSFQSRFRYEGHVPATIIFGLKHSATSHNTWRWWLLPMGFLLGVLLASQVAAHGDLHTRIVALTAQLHQEPDNAALYVRRGDLYRQDHNWQAALEDLTRAVTLDPTLPTVDLLRGLTYLEARQCTAARQALAAFLRRYPAHAEALVAQARAAVCLGNSLTAAAKFTRAIALLPRSDYYFERAQALAAAGGTHLDEAIRSLDEGLAALGFILPFHELALEIELRQGDVAAALQRLEHILAAVPRREAWLARRGAILEQAGRPAAAYAAYAAALTALETLPTHRQRTRTMIDLGTRVHAALERLRPHATP